MRRLFGKSDKTDNVQPVVDSKDEPAESTPGGQDRERGEKSRRRKGKSKIVESDNDKGGKGDAESIETRREPRTKRKEKSESQVINIQNEDDYDNDDGESHQSVGDSGESSVDLVQPKPRRVKEHSKIQELPSVPSQSDDDSEKDIVDHSPVMRKSKQTKGESHAKTLKKQKKGETKTKRKVATRQEPEPEENVQYVNKEDLKHLTKLEPGKDGHFFASTYNFKKPISGFRVRARLLKYPTFNDQEVWKGDLAVIEEREFQWQEKVFSKVEAKRYQKIENCITEQEKNYHEEIQQNPSSLGSFLYSYVNNDAYVIRKTQKTLTRRCPVPHLQKDKLSKQRFSSINGNSFSDDLLGEDEGILSSDDSIEFDKPVSSSTPKSIRKERNKENERSAKQEKKVRERKEKESKDLERQNCKLKESLLKKEKEEEKKRKQEEAKVAEKLKKLGTIHDKELEHKDEYVKKYRYNRRPSLPLGARFRAIQLSPSPRISKQRKALKSLKHSTNIEKGKERSHSLDSTRGKGKTVHGESEADSPSSLTRKAVKLNQSNQEMPNIRRVDRSRRGRKFHERLLYQNSQTMFVMASLPHTSGRNREFVVCMMRSIPTQGVLICKPPLGYRNIEAKRNQVFRISCELSQSPAEFSQFNYSMQDSSYKKLDTTTNASDREEFGGFFEIVPKNELRLSVMGEITTAEGFDTSPLCVYYHVDIPKGWRNDSVMSNTEGITHTCFTNNENVAHFSHEFSFHLAFSMDSLEESDSYPVPVITIMVASMSNASPSVMYEGYGYVNIPVTPGCHFIKIRTWKPRPRTTVEKMREAFLNITPSLQDVKFAHIPVTEYEDNRKINLVSLQTNPSGSIKLRLHVIHQSSTIIKDHGGKLDFLEKMSSATILKSVQAVIEAFQRARKKAMCLKDQYE